MFPSHRPKIFRSRLGCCICKAKSSSSRFTSSAKYEQHFQGCFVLTDKRQGEICNACVLLVKRWSKLPQGSNKNWKHVVDSKATVKRNTRPRRTSRGTGLDNSIQTIHEETEPSTLKSQGSPEVDDALADDDDELDCLSPSLACASPSPSPSPSEASDEFTNSSTNSSNEPQKKSVTTTACQTSFLFPALTSSASNKLPYIDLSMWRREEICCGMIFRGPHGEVLVDPKLLNPLCTCSTSKAKTQSLFQKPKMVN